MEPLLNSSIKEATHRTEGLGANFWVRQTANAVTVLAVTTHDLIDAQKALPQPGVGESLGRGLGRRGLG
ncbi:MAG: hypothetical protein K0M46_10945, partial [Thiobacillus sp.]|nr:hypothetical protein [Thiobacillus sp.]